MKKTLVITVDLGHFKAYRITKNSHESPRVELIESYDAIESHGKLSEKVSDSAGRFGLAGGRKGSAKGYGEPHNIALEAEKRATKLIARDIGYLVNSEGCNEWHLAATKDINNQIVESLDAEVKAKLDKNLKVDLTKASKAELLSRFQF